MNVPPDFASLRTNTVAIKEPRSASDLEASLARAVIHSRAGEVVCTFKAGNLDCGLELYFSPSQDNAAFFKIANGVSIRETPSIIVGERTLPLNPDENGHSTLHLWIDGSIIELFVDSRRVITVRFYAVNHGASEIHAKWTGSPESLVSMIVSDIIPISSDRMTT